MTVATISEYLEAATWVTATLAGISGVQEVEEHPGSELGAYPRITFMESSWTDLSEVGEARVWSELLLLVTGIAKGESTLSLRDIAIAIDQRLHRASGTTSSAQIISSVRRGGFHDASVENGVSYRRLGGFYSVLVQPTNP